MVITRSIPAAVKMALLFCFLVVVLLATYFIKKNTPINRPANESGIVYDAWYSQHSTASSAPSDEWTLDPRIPVNYIPVPGEDGLFMVVDDSGLVIQYMRADYQDDGSILWSEEVREGETVYEPVEGLDNVYQYTDENGDEAFLRYIRNDDNTFAFVDVDREGIPFTNGTDASTIGDNWAYTGEDNLYALLDDNGVVTGYYDRFLEDDGNYTWMFASMPQPVPGRVGNSSSSFSRQVFYPMNNGMQGTGNQPGKNIYYLDPFNSEEITNESDGTRTVTNHQISSETIDGVTYTYQTDITSVYLSNGTLWKTSSEGPYLISQTEAETLVSEGMIEASIGGEYARVSSHVNYDTGMAAELLSYLNARRNIDGLPTLSMDMGSDLYKIACIRCADMAIYDNASTSSETYGSIADLCARYGLNVIPMENVLKTSNQTAEQVNLILQANEETRKVRQSMVTQCAIVVVNNNGQQYIVELYAY